MLIYRGKSLRSYVCAYVVLEMVKDEEEYTDESDEEDEDSEDDDDSDSDYEDEADSESETDSDYEEDSESESESDQNESDDNSDDNSIILIKQERLSDLIILIARELLKALMKSDNWKSDSDF